MQKINKIIVCINLAWLCRGKKMKPQTNKLLIYTENNLFFSSSLYRREKN